jgi:hypothetical protein
VALDRLDQGNLQGVFPNKPAINGGDEPAYLLMIYSIVHDHDFDLKNNYENSHSGGPDGGRILAGFFYEHHSMWFVDGQQVHWSEVVQTGVFPGTNRASFYYKPGFEGLKDEPEISWHPYIFPLLLAGPAALFEPIATLETTALITVTLLGIVALWMLTQIFQNLGFSKWPSLFYAALAILCTPWWHYNRMLFSEGTCAFLMTSSIYFWSEARKGRDWAGYLVGLPFVVLFLTKPPLVLCAIPFVIDWAMEKKWKQFFALGVWLTLALTLWLLQNDFLWGSPLLMNAYPMHVEYNDVLYAMFCSLNQGIFWSCPTLVIAFYGYWVCFIKDRRTFRVLFLSFAYYWIFLLFVHNWYGGAQYGPRYMVPILPFPGIVTGYALRERLTGFNFWSIVFALILISALAISALAGILPMAFFTLHPVTYLLSFVGIHL